ncbi:MAG TPA: hypothetical protein VFK16_03380 [Gemmatimonadaceae bacterium]|jgi:peptidoglycan/LPS O-acetylase OafA/YrhL|nr:hypothetical protein [Gemmatimonadaceae bacterium]
MNSPWQWAILMIFPAAVVAGALVARRRWTGGWRTAALVPIIAVLGDLVFSWITTYMDHNEKPLWPYELMMITTVAAVFLIATASMRHDSLKKRR